MGSTVLPSETKPVKAGSVSCHILCKNNEFERMSLTWDEIKIL